MKLEVQLRRISSSSAVGVMRYAQLPKHNK